MKTMLPVWIGLFLFILSACSTELGTGVEGLSNEELTPKALVEQAEAKYAEYLAANDGDRAAATEKTAAYLRELPNMKEVTVRGSDNLFVIMEDGSELLLMLGKDRL